MFDVGPSLEQIFDALGEDAEYRVGGAGTPVDIKVMPATDDQISAFGETRIQSASGSFDVLKSAVAAPAKGDTIKIVDTRSANAGKTYTVKSPPRLKDSRGFIWFLDCHP